MKLHILLALLLLAPLASANLVTQGSGLDASLLYYQPIPAQPGDLIDVYVQVTNTGGSKSKPGTITFVDNGPFSLESESSRVKSFQGIPGQQSFLINTKVRVAKDANEGTNNLKVRIQEDGETNYNERDLEIVVTGTQSSINIVSAELNPEEVLPGESATLDIVVENIGSTEVRNVDVTLNLEELNFVPLGSSNSKTINSLSGGEKHSFSFMLTTYPDTPSQAYQIPMTIEYDDETGNQKTQEKTVGVLVGAKPELLVYFDEISLTKQKPEGEAIIRFVNKGLSEIKLLEMTVLENDNIEVLSESPTIYVGNIDNDDYESASLRLRAQEDVTLQVTYKDALNRAYTETITLPLTLTESADDGQPVLVWILVFALAGAAFWWWRKKKSSKKA